MVDQEHAALVRNGHEVERFERLSDEIEAFPLPRKIGVAAGAVWNPAVGHSFRQVLARFRPDVVHIHNVFPLLSPSVLVACRRERVPAVVTLHNYRQICPSGDCFRSGKVCLDCVGRHPGPAVEHGCYRGSTLATLPLAIGSVVQHRAWKTLPSAYVFLSEAQRRLFSTLGLPRERCFVKPNFVPPASRKGFTEDRIVYTGRLTEAKGPLVLMRAWDLFQRREPSTGAPRLRLTIAGSGPLEKDVRKWAAATPAVDAVGLLSPDDCARLLSTARAAIVPSEWPEPFGLAVVEAFAAGVAVIAPAHGSFPELITHGVDGLLYQPGAADALAKVLRSVADAPGWFDRLGGAARQAYERRFRPEANLARLEEIYLFAMRSPRHADLQ